MSAPVPGVAYRRVSPELLIDFGVAYFRDDESPVVANLLRLIDELADAEPGDLPEGSELLTADDAQRRQSTAARRARQTPTLD